ncbi:hypothetical protein ACFLXB_09005 [Chloroflexota bacterium]
MTNSNPSDRPSMDRHRRQRLWQIIVPIILISIFIFFVGGYFVLGGGSQTRVWADISIIWIVLPLLLIFLIALAIIIGLIYVLNKINRSAPLFTNKIQKTFILIQQKTHSFTDSSVKPVFWINQSKAGIVRLFGKKSHPNSPK